MSFLRSLLCSFLRIHIFHVSSGFYFTLSVVSPDCLPRICFFLRDFAPLFFSHFSALLLSFFALLQCCGFSSWCAFVHTRRYFRFRSPRFFGSILVLDLFCDLLSFDIFALYLFLFRRLMSEFGPFQRAAVGFGWGALWGRGGGWGGGGWVGWGGLGPGCGVDHHHACRTISLNVSYVSFVPA